MGAVFAAAAYAPITTVIILFELTGDWRIILPLMLTIVVATLLSQKLLRGESIYRMTLSRRGVGLKFGRDVDLLRGVLVGEVMTYEVESVSHDLTMITSVVFAMMQAIHGDPIVAPLGDAYDEEVAARLRRAG